MRHWWGGALLPLCKGHTKSYGSRVEPQRRFARLIRRRPSSTPRVGKKWARMRPAIALATAAFAVVGLVLTPGFAQERRSTQPPDHFDPASLPDQELGRRISIKPEDLPAPKTPPIVSARSLTLPYQG